MSSKLPNLRQSIWTKQAPITVVGVILLGIIGSTLYDLLVKPGLTGFGRFALDVLTLGSTRVLDSSYASAALDPNPVTGLLLLQGALLAAAWPAFFMLGKQIAEYENNKVQKRVRDLPDTEKISVFEQERDRLFKKMRQATLGFWILFTPWIFISIVAFSIHNQSVLVWRIFNANLAIISPLATSAEIAEFRATFAKIKNKADYQNLALAMSRFAANKNVQLYVVETW